MTLAEWRAVPDVSRPRIWDELTADQKAALFAEEAKERLDAPQTTAPAAPAAVGPSIFETPWLVNLLYVLAGLCAVGAFFLAVSGHAPAAVWAGSAVIPLIYWGQLLHAVARTAYFTERTARHLTAQTPPPAP